MRCCASQTISTVPNAAPPSSRAREVAARFDALLMAAAFKPLAAAIGYYGDLVVGVATQAMVRGERGGADRFERSIALSQPDARTEAGVP